ncbi:Protein eiger [Frankliniella fusca]|uniref:Protein eiger n=1 Tax=Frankliniella fusca TaxID=407009 RepID=A0AAE1HVY9_9NEOP|nr:Protein eiger [Frankliniella fusca]
MVAMASDSYLLKAPAAPAQAQWEARCRCRRCCDRRGAPACGGEVAMAVTLVVLAAGLLSLAGIVFYLNVQLTQVRAKVAAQEHQLGVVNTKLTNLNLIEQFKAFEAVPPVEMDDFDEPGDELLDDDDTQPVYPDWENSNIESRVQPDRSAHSVQPLQPAGSLREEDPTAAPVDEKNEDDGTELSEQPLQPAGSLREEDPAAAPVDEEDEDDEDDSTELIKSASSQSDSEDAEDAEMREEPPVKFPEDSETRVRRDVRPQAQLRLYHTLQSPGPGPAVPGAETWSAYGSRQAQPMYAERPPTGFVAPPRPARTNSYHATTPGTPIASRRSRVMNAAAAAPRPQQAQHHRTGRRQRLQELQQQAPLQEVPQDPQDVSRQDVEVGRRRQPWAHFGSGPWRAGEYEQRERDPRRWRGVRSIDTTVEVEQTWRPYTPVVEGPAIAAHFVADSTRHRGTHHYDDNGRLKHPTGEYVDWRASDWVRELGLDQHFRLAEAGGHVTVDTPGLYLVYAQVNYANDRDENGFWVYRNARKELLCAVTAAVSSASAHANTCFTAGVLLLARGDRVSLRDLAGDRYRVLDHPGRSFIGLVNLSSCKLKQEPQASRMAVAA